MRDSLYSAALEITSSFKRDILLNLPGRGFCSRLFFCCQSTAQPAISQGKNGTEVIDLHNSIARDLIDVTRYINQIKTANQERQDSALRKNADSTLENSTQNLICLPDAICNKITAVEQQLDKLKESTEKDSLEKQLTRLKDILIDHLPDLANALDNMGINKFYYDTLYEHLRGANTYQQRNTSINR